MSKHYSRGRSDAAKGTKSGRPHTPWGFGDKASQDQQYSDRHEYDEGYADKKNGK